MVEFIIVADRIKMTLCPGMVAFIITIWAFNWSRAKWRTTASFGRKNKGLKF